jgi:hypothetical protein
MRGGSQAHLLEATDGHFYVVKFLNNPVCGRTLINEWMSSAVLKHLQIATPETIAIHVSERFLAENPDVYVQLRVGRRSIGPGLHFGSRFPSDPATTVVYDFLPDALFEMMDNLADFRGVLAFDKWMGNTDSRQAVFSRSGLKRRTRDNEKQKSKLNMVAHMIDNGHVFEGANWRLGTGPLQSLYFRSKVYEGVRGLEDFEPWLTRILDFPDDVLQSAVKALPSSWLGGEEAALESLLARLQARRKSVPHLVCQSCSDQVNSFPHWQRQLFRSYKQAQS